MLLKSVGPAAIANALAGDGEGCVRGHLQQAGFEGVDERLGRRHDNVAVSAEWPE